MSDDTDDSKNKPFQLVDKSQNSAHWSVEDMLLEALEFVRANPEFKYGSVVLIDNRDTPRKMRDYAAGYANDAEVSGILLSAAIDRARHNDAPASDKPAS